MSKEEKIKISEKNMVINISENKNIIEWEFPSFPFNCDIYLEDNVVLNSHCLVNIKNVFGKIYIHSKNKSVVNISLGITFSENNNLEIVNCLSDDDAYSKITIHAIQNDDGKTTLKTVGIVNENTKDNEFLEQIKVLNVKKQQITCLPELLVYSNETSANHNCTIKTIKDDELFYLNSKGITNDQAKQLITDGFLNGMLKN